MNWVPKTLPTRRTLSTIIQQTCPATVKSRKFITVKSSNDKNDDLNTPIDWDVAWKDFKSGPSGGRRFSSVKTMQQSPRFKANSPRDDIRRQEKLILDTWVNDSSSQLAIIAVVVTFIVFLLISVPPPTDARCTLP